MSSNNYGTTIAERLTPNAEPIRANIETALRSLRVAIPGIVQSFDAAKQTVTVQPALTEHVRLDGQPTKQKLPLLLDVPVVLPRAGGYTLTMPITAGDECLVVFADMCIDAWWQSAGVQDQVERRRHDLSDGFALMGCWSQPRVLGSYSTSAAELRSDDGATKVSVQSGQVTVTATKIILNGTSEVDINAPTININGSSAVNIATNTKIDSKLFDTHTHSGVAPGGSTTGPVA